MKTQISIINLPEISAIYYALLQCGYDYYAVEKDADLVKKVDTFRMAQDDILDRFFKG